MPSPKWIQKHGRVYCSVCGNKFVEAYVPTTRKSVSFRQRFATCKDHINIVSEHINKYIYNNYNEEANEASFSIRY